MGIEETGAVDEIATRPFGEVLNPTVQWLEYAKIVATFYDADDTMIGSDFTYTVLDLIPPGDRGVFDVSVDITTLGGEVDSYDLQVQARPASQPPYQDLTAEVTNQYESYGYWHLEGLVYNRGSLDCEYVKVIAAFYDSSDQIVGVVRGVNRGPVGVVRVLPVLEGLGHEVQSSG